MHQPRPPHTEYLRKARSNRAFAETLDPNNPTHAGWALVALFYSALHFVQAYSAKFGHYYSSHKDRNADMQRNPVFDEIIVDYNELAILGWNARYTCMAYGATTYQEALDCINAIQRHIEDRL